MDKLYNLFDNKAALYAANRPGYSPHVLKYLQEDLGYSPPALGADIGCGTGQLTKILAGYFDLLYAVEPNDFMMKECQKRLCNYINIHYIYHCAERTEIDNNILDYITVAQAFHLFHNMETLRELKRILKPDERLIIIYFGIALQKIPINIVIFRMTIRNTLIVILLLIELFLLHMLYREEIHLFRFLWKSWQRFLQISL